MKTFGKMLHEMTAGAQLSKGRQAFPTPYLEKRALFPAQINGPPAIDLGMIVVIPAKDEPRLLDSLESLRKAHQPDGAVEVIVVINDGEADRPIVQKRNARLFAKATRWAIANSSSAKKFHILYHSQLPAKRAGVGLARKIGMDEAVYRFAQIPMKKGLIICFDADTHCKRNYFRSIQQYFAERPKLHAANIYYEHPLTGTAHPKKVYRAIALYELHLRYYTHAQRYAGFPFACETIGSAMAVRADAYQQQGGMNKRKAGEDFYFLHKFTPLGHFGEIKTTTVIPSPRRSDRVPFGTGKAVAKMAANTKETVTTYAPQSFEDLKIFFKKMPALRKWKPEDENTLLEKLPDSIAAFLRTTDWQDRLTEIIANTTNPRTFRIRFFRWFNAFMVMKYVHYARDHHHANVPVEEAAAWLLTTHFHKKLRGEASAQKLLRILRKLDRQQTDYFGKS